MKKALTAAITAAAVLLTPAIAQDHGHEGHDHSGHKHAEDAKKDKVIIKRTLAIKGVAIIEFVHNLSDGIVTMAMTDEKKVALVPEMAPRLNLIADGKRKQLKSTVVKGETSQFTVTDDLLKAALNGKVVVKVAGKTYQVTIDPHFGHNHGPGEHH